MSLTVQFSRNKNYKKKLKMQIFPSYHLALSYTHLISLLHKELCHEVKNINDHRHLTVFNDFLLWDNHFLRL